MSPMHCQSSFVTPDEHVHSGFAIVSSSHRLHVSIKHGSRGLCLSYCRNHGAQIQFDDGQIKPKGMN